MKKKVKSKREKIIVLDTFDPLQMRINPNDTLRDGPKEHKWLYDLIVVISIIGLIGTILALIFIK
jgi:hypothetical protein